MDKAVSQFSRFSIKDCAVDKRSSQSSQFCSRKNILIDIKHLLCYYVIEKGVAV